MLLLDIDEVLMGWDHYKLYKPGVLGWEKWRHIPNRLYFNVVADDMLEYLKDNFGEHIVWLTTWLHRGMCNSEFTPETNFGPFPTVTSIFGLLDGTSELERGDLVNSIAKYNCISWWKLVYVAHLIEAGKIPEKVIWIDDDIEDNLFSVEQVLEAYDVRDRFYLISPQDALSREQIEAAKEWYYAETNQETVE